MTDFDDDAAILAQLAEEFDRKGDTGTSFVFDAPPVVLVSLAGLVQVALRSPFPSPPMRTVGVTFLALVKAYFADCPTVSDVLAAGDESVTARPARSGCGTQTRH